VFYRSLTQESIDSNKNYILAIEMANLDGSWPSHVPGDPIGDFDLYAALYGQRRQHSSANSPSVGVIERVQSTLGGHHAAVVAGSPLWERELTGTLDTLFGGIATELKETTTGIVTTARYNKELINFVLTTLNVRTTFTNTTTVL